MHGPIPAVLPTMRNRPRFVQPERAYAELEVSGGVNGLATATEKGRSRAAFFLNNQSLKATK
ncbi:MULTISPECIES: hypothetical protein [unclassified Mesorhizobium]|uniref:hypothetical protein n=1 Tax=unclassified Mesorhizobium TaxID=325217 RepID=UPI001129E6EF|nr:MULTISPECIES: hypothetical protein [unclassified Mesorhizobium]MCA0059248.1 hypothetical protein [Mesorhizobium sp. B261B1A]